MDSQQEPEQQMPLAERSAEEELQEEELLLLSLHSCVENHSTSSHSSPKFPTHTLSLDHVSSSRKCSRRRARA